MTPHNNETVKSLPVVYCYSFIGRSGESRSRVRIQVEPSRYLLLSLGLSLAACSPSGGNSNLVGRLEPQQRELLHKP